jgi:hypothetical protein
MSDSRNPQEMRAEQARRNKALITRYYDLALNKKDFAAARAYIGPYYRQHSTPDDQYTELERKNRDIVLNF